MLLDLLGESFDCFERCSVIPRRFVGEDYYYFDSSDLTVCEFNCIPCFLFISYYLGGASSEGFRILLRSLLKPPTKLLEAKASFLEGPLPIILGACTSLDTSDFSGSAAPVNILRP